MLSVTILGTSSPGKVSATGSCANGCSSCSTCREIPGSASWDVMEGFYSTKRKKNNNKKIPEPCGGNKIWPIFYLMIWLQMNPCFPREKQFFQAKCDMTHGEGCGFPPWGVKLAYPPQTAKLAYPPQTACSWLGGCKDMKILIFKIQTQGQTEWKWTGLVWL